MIEQAIKNATNMGLTLYACIPFPNASDSHLFKVLCGAKNNYVVWTFNSQDGGFHHGHYHRDLSNALQDLTITLIELGWE